MWMAAQALTLVAGELDTAILLADKSLSLNPNAPNAWWARGVASIYFGGSELTRASIAIRAPVA
jgi:hypothetical protein